MLLLLQQVARKARESKRYNGMSLPVCVIIFGSYVNNSVHEDSDIDLVVILKEKGIDSTYRQRMDRTIRISKLLNPLRKHIAINVLVYTKGEWVYLIKKGSHFLKEIDKKGFYLPS